MNAACHEKRDIVLLDGVWLRCLWYKLERIDKIEPVNFGSREPQWRGYRLFLNYVMKYGGPEETVELHPLRCTQSVRPSGRWIFRLVSLSKVTAQKTAQVSSEA